MVTSAGSYGLSSQAASIDALVAQYMALERKPVEQLEARKDQLNVQSAVFTDVESKIEELRDLAEGLCSGSESTFSLFNTATSDSAVATASASSSAASGTYVLENIVLAASHRVQSLPVGSSWTAGEAEAGSFSINGALVTVSAGDTLAGVRDAINRASYQSGRGVTATIISGRLVLETTTAGADNRLAVADVSGSVLSAIGLASTASSQTYADGTLWEGDPAASTWTRTIDLGGSQTVSRLAWSRDASGVSTDRVPRDYTVEYLDADGVTWHTLKTVSGNSLAAGETKNDTFYPVTTSQLRITVTATSDGQAPAMDSLAVYNDVGTYSQAELQAPQTGSLTVNGVAVTTTKNTGLTDIVDGLSFDLRSAGGPVTITVTQDTDSVRTRIGDFLTKFNSFVDYLKLKSSSVKDAAGDYTRGPLSGNSLYLRLQSGLVSDIMSRVTGVATGDPGRLADIGITMDDNLHFTITDSATLDKWLEDKPTAVSYLFGNTDGIAQRIYDRLTPFLEASTSGSKSYMDAEQAAITSEKSAINDRISVLNERLAQREVQLRTDFARLLQMMTEMTQQQSYLQSILSSGLV
ncbi:MAG: flagellar filament capping protein FliD [Dehalococcoidales bacterium]|nr:flagellar filament capping protein FliD [Dehalococcoidales bacterium]